MTLRSTIDSLLLWLHEKQSEMDKQRDKYRQQYREEVLLYNLRKKPMPRRTRLILIGLCLVCLALYLIWVMQ